MLLDFSVENYKSFLKKVQFSMTPAPKQHGLDYSILTEKIGRKSIKGLCSSVIYGPNASGKTNIIGAMDALRAIVLRGNIRNAEEQSSPNKAAYDLELIPNNLLEDIEPVVFKISFVDNSMKFDYELSILLGTFLEDTYQRSVKYEKLLINEEMMFERTDKVHLGDYKKIGKYIPGQTLKNSDAVSLFANQSLAEDELFLSGDNAYRYFRETRGLFTVFLAGIPGENHPLHHPKFQLDERILSYSVETLYKIITTL